MTEINKILIAHGDEQYEWANGFCSLCGGIGPSLLSDLIENGLITEVLIQIHRSGGPDGIKFSTSEKIVSLPILHLFDADGADFDVISKFLDRPDGMVLTRMIDGAGEMHIQWRWNEDGPN